MKRKTHANVPWLSLLLALLAMGASAQEAGEPCTEEDRAGGVHVGTVEDGLFGPLCRLPPEADCALYAANVARTQKAEMLMEIAVNVGDADLARQLWGPWVELQGEALEASLLEFCAYGISLEKARQRREADDGFIEEPGG